MGRNKPIFPEHQPFLQKKCPCWESTIFPAATKMQTPALFSSTPSLAPPSNLRSTWPEIPASQHTIQQVGHYPLTIPRKSIVGHPGRSFFHTGRNPAGHGEDLRRPSRCRSPSYVSSYRLFRVLQIPTFNNPRKS